MLTKIVNLYLTKRVMLHWQIFFNSFTNYWVSKYLLVCI